jgi:hypothetical protein
MKMGNIGMIKGRDWVYQKCTDKDTDREEQCSLILSMDTCTQVLTNMNGSQYPTVGV